MKKKTFATIGMIVSILVVVAGIVAMTGSLGGETSTNSGASYLYDSGYTTFGADFYTYVSNNAAEAASAARTTANNLHDIATLLKNVCGIFLMGFGLIGFSFFGVIRAHCKEQEAVVPAEPDMVFPEPLPASDEAPL